MAGDCTMSPQELAEALGGAKQSGSGWFALAPCHDDHNPSLSIWTVNGKTRFKCQAGCDNKASFKAVAQKVPEAFEQQQKAKKAPFGTIVDTYDYTDEQGGFLFQVCRMSPGASARFRQRTKGPDGEWVWGLKGARNVLYCLPEIVGSPQVFVVEGEKDANSLRAMGMPATTSPMGAGNNKWKPEHTKTLKSKRVAVFADADFAGRNHAAQTVNSLLGQAKAVYLLECPEPHNDVSDWIAAGATQEDIVERVAEKVRNKQEVTEPIPLSVAEPAPPAQATPADNGGAPPNPAHDEPGGHLSWRKGLILNAHDQPKPNIANVLHALRAAPVLQGIVRFDTFTQRTIVHGQTPWGSRLEERWADSDDVFLAEWLQREGINAGVDTVTQAVTAIAQKNPFDVLADWLNALTWDGTPRLDTAARFFGAPDDLSCSLVRRWLISAVARGLQPGVQVDHVLVLEGNQETRKSTALRALFDPMDKGWFRDSLPPLDSKDAELQLIGAWCIEISELDSVNSRRAEVERVKAFITRRTDSYRAPYARRVQDHPRRTVLAGTTNERQYLKDSTGNRRWWMIPGGKLDIPGITRNQEQLWAEAVQQYKAGETWWFEPEDAANVEIREMQEDRRSENPWEADVLLYLSHEGRVGVTLPQLFLLVDLPLVKQNQAHANTMFKIVNSAGWVKKKIRVHNVQKNWYVEHSDITGHEVERQLVILPDGSPEFQPRDGVAN